MGFAETVELSELVRNQLPDIDLLCIVSRAVLQSGILFNRS
jgi:hypothetical protein